MPYFIRSACLTNYVQVARAVQLDPYRQLRAAGISRAALLTPDLKLPVAAVIALLEASAAQSGVDDFGLRMAESRHLSNLGPLGLIASTEATLRRALASMARHHALHNEALFIRIEESDGIALIRQDVILGQGGAFGQAMALIVGVLFRVLASILGPDWKPHSVCFSHPAPANLALYRRVFGPNIGFERDFDGVICRASDLDMAMPHYDPVLARNALQYVAALAGQPPTALVDQVRALVLALLATGDCSIECVAQHLGISRRTLHRRLADAQQSFMAILDQVRSDLALRYVASHERPLSSVATLLGFASLSAFSRWFNGRFQCSATAWRLASRHTVRRP
ncbi:MAG: AraC family transcriptional regulator ligand-binding domain-containing protein [Pseudomonadota bacterium]